METRLTDLIITIEQTLISNSTTSVPSIKAVSDALVASTYNDSALKNRLSAIENDIPLSASNQNQLVTHADLPAAYNDATIRARLTAIEADIPSTASASNKLATIADIPAASTGYDDTALKARVAAIEADVPANASSSNKFATKADIPAATTGYDDSALRARVSAIEADIPSKASSSNLLATLSDISTATTGYDDSAVKARIATIESEIPSNASSSNKLVTVADLPAAGSSVTIEQNLTSNSTTSVPSVAAVKSAIANANATTEKPYYYLPEMQEQYYLNGTTTLTSSKFFYTTFENNTNTQGSPYADNQTDPFLMLNQTDKTSLNVTVGASYQVVMGMQVLSITGSPSGRFNFWMVINNGNPYPTPHTSAYTSGASDWVQHTQIIKATTNTLKMYVNFPSVSTGASVQYRYTMHIKQLA